MNWLITVALQPIHGLPSAKVYTFNDKGQAYMFLHSCKDDGQKASICAAIAKATGGAV